MPFSCVLVLVIVHVLVIVLGVSLAEIILVVGEEMTKAEPILMLVIE